MRMGISSSNFLAGPEIFAVFELAGRHNYGIALVLNQEHDEFRWYGLAGVSPDDMNINGTFIEGLAKVSASLLFRPSPALRSIPPGHKQTHARYGDG
jgi:hypothetical protein